MKFGKSYYAATTSLPEEWKEKAIDYKQLKKLINEVVLELERLGLNPTMLKRILVTTPQATEIDRQTTSDRTPIAFQPAHLGPPRIEETESDLPFGSGVIYEVDQSHPGVDISPAVRLRVAACLPDALTSGVGGPGPSETATAMCRQPQSITNGSLRRSSFSSRASSLDDNVSAKGSPEGSASSIRLFESISNGMTNQEEVVIPLTSDSAFLHLLSSALETLSTLYQSVFAHCEVQVQELTTLISSSARPRSRGGKSDLDAWRSIFQLWVDTEIFESLSERDKGELPVQESEDRLRKFTDLVVRKGYADRKHMKVVSSREAFDKFCALNILLLDVKKVHTANSRARILLTWLVACSSNKRI
ncbi:hypothetical protein FRB95_008425 [Tulasnella sp. JGI-2019a]|nr:hypothetical protein FRB95_008425 [Tulasnella sp. JGI-2019a]